MSVEGTEQLESYFGSYMPQLFYSVVAPVTLFACLAPLCLPAAVALLACVPLIPASIVAVQKIAKRSRTCRASPRSRYTAPTRSATRR